MNAEEAPSGDGRLRAHALLRRLGILDWVSVALLVAGVCCVASGLLPAAEAEANLRRIAPLLIFLASVIVLAELTKQARVFDVIAAGMAIAGRGNYAWLFVFCVVFASLTTTFLNLDTTAVLLTPVMLALAPKARIAPLPLAMTTVWLANTASLLLPVSNLTNLLAADRVALGATEFAARMWAPQLVSIAVTMVFLWICYWRLGERGAERYETPTPVPPEDRVLFWAAGGSCLLFVAGVLSGTELYLVATVAAVLVAGFFAWRRRAALHLGLIPWRLLVFVTGLFLVIPTLSRYGLAEATAGLVGTSVGADGGYRAAAVGAALANVVNNLPAYVAVESAIPASNGDGLLALLVGVNLGPIITPWGSLATLLWFEWCRRWGVLSRSASSFSPVPCWRW